MSRYRDVVVALAATCLLPVACARNTAPGNDRSADSAPAPMPARLVPVERVFAQADLAAIEPSTMTSDEYERALGGQPGCRFEFTRVGMPVLVNTERTGIVKLNGNLVELPITGRAGSASGQLTFSVGGITVSVVPLEPGGEADANLVFELEGGRTVGYRGYYACER